MPAASTCPSFPDQPAAAKPSQFLQLEFRGCFPPATRRLLLRLLEQLANLCEFGLYEWSYSGTCTKRQNDSVTKMEIGAHGSNQNADLSTANSAAGQQTTYPVQSHSVIASDKKKASPTLLVIILIVVGIVLAAIAAVIAFVIWRQKKEKKNSSSSYELLMK